MRASALARWVARDPEISALMGAGAIYFGTARQHRAARAGPFPTRLLRPLLAAGFAVENWTVFSLLGLEHDASALHVFGLLVGFVYAYMAAVVLLVYLLYH